MFDIYLLETIINGILLGGVLALLALGLNLIFGVIKFGIAPQPVAHSSHIWNFLGMVLSGLAFALAGGCPGRQLFLAGEGDGDSAVFVLGMIVGAGVAHNFTLAGIPDKMVDGALNVGGISTAGMVAVITGIIFCCAIGYFMRERA